MELSAESSRFIVINLIAAYRGAQYELLLHKYRNPANLVAKYEALIQDLAAAGVTFPAEDLEDARSGGEAGRMLISVMESSL
jgi:hypothetical protein